MSLPLETTLFAVQRNQDGEHILATTRSYKTQTYVDLRLYYRNPESSELIPTKKGVTMSEEVFKTFCDEIKKLTLGS